MIEAGSIKKPTKLCTLQKVKAKAKAVESDQITMVVGVLAHRKDTYSEDSIGALRNAGVDFDRHRLDGIEMFAFGELLHDASEIVRSSLNTWISFQATTFDEPRLQHINEKIYHHLSQYHNTFKKRARPGMTLTETEQKFNHDLKLLPKSHSLVHFTRDVRKVGPLYWMTVFKYEMCKGIVRNYSHVNHCFTNVPFTMANKFQFHYANSLLSWPMSLMKQTLMIQIAINVMQGKDCTRQVRLSFKEEPTQEVLVKAFCLNYAVPREAIVCVKIYEKNFEGYFEFNPDETILQGSRISMHMDAQPIPTDDNNNSAHFRPLQPDELGSLPKNTVKSLPINTFWSLPMIAL
uniref:Uncharacterized protein n=1 Tax=Plectus sambesii TaxID=2011161 RepID=A0A914UQY6_9BILA